MNGVWAEVGEEPNSLQFLLPPGKDDSMTPQYKLKQTGPVMKWDQKEQWVWGCEGATVRKSSGMISFHERKSN